MPRHLYPTDRPQSIMEVLDAAVRIFARTVPRCLPYGVLVALIGQVGQSAPLLAGAMAPQGGATLGYWQGPLAALGALLSVLLWNATLLRQRTALCGLPRTLAAELLQALRRLPAASALLAMALLPLAPVLLVPKSWQPAALVLLAIPASMLSIGASCGWVTALEGREGWRAAAARGFRLAAGHWWRVGLIYTVGLLVWVAAGSAIIILAALLLASRAADAPGPMMGAALIAVTALAVPFFAALLLAVDGDLEVRRTGQLSSASNSA